MHLEQIVEQIDLEIRKLQQARAVLNGVEAQAKRKPGRPKKSPLVSRILAVVPAKRVMSKKGRAKAKKVSTRALRASTVEAVEKALKVSPAKPAKKATKAVKATEAKS